MHLLVRFHRTSRKVDSAPLVSVTLSEMGEGQTCNLDHFFCLHMVPIALRSRLTMYQLALSSHAI